MINERNTPLPGSRTRRALDRIGMSASLLCAVHCAALPLALVVLPLAGAHILLDGTIELVMIVVAATVGVAGLGSSYRVHRRLNPLMMMAAGAAILIANVVGHDSHAVTTESLHPYIAAVGGMMIAFAHRINMRLCDDCERCAHDHTHDEHR